MLQELLDDHRTILHQVQEAEAYPTLIRGRWSPYRYHLWYLLLLWLHRCRHLHVHEIKERQRQQRRYRRCRLMRDNIFTSQRYLDTQNSRF